jgi:hypothetical protein
VAAEIRRRSLDLTAKDSEPNPRREKPYGSTYTLRIVCRNRNAALLRTGKAQSMVHPGFCCIVLAGVGLRLSTGGVAIRIGGGGLVSGSSAALVAGEKESRLISE